MATWRTARAIKTLQAEINAAHPGRPKTADGTIGDVRHQNESHSDHNPNERGVVTAWDITTADFTIPLAESLRRLGERGDKRVKYVIYRGRIAGPAAKGWAWRKYSGFSDHFDHIHLSVSADPNQYDRTDPWFPIVEPKPTPAPSTKEWDEMATKDEIKAAMKEVADDLFAKLHAEHVLILHGDKGHPVSLDSIASAVKVPGAPA
jgi:hypothetical protein